MHATKAFSLVELSIVLVILGLLTGGILAGQSLIRAAELRAVSSEYNRYVTALGTFRDKYFQLPGDFQKATDFWGTAANCPGHSGNTTVAVQATCNGNDDGRIQPNAPSSNEIFRAWQHLANAGLIEGTYLGVPNSATWSDPHTVIGSNAPASKLGKAGWALYHFTNSALDVSNTNYFEADYNNFFFYGASSGTNVPNQQILSPEEAWNIDTKMDDGRPAQGRVMTFEAHGGTASDDCTDLAPSNSLSRTASNYVLSNSGPYCALMMKTGF